MKKIKYINTDLNLKSSSHFNELNDFLTQDGIFSLHYETDNNEWSGSYEIENECEIPKETFDLFLKHLSRMDEISKKQWDRCSVREFDIGYECGQEPWAYNNEIPSSILKALTELDIRIRITLYPEDKKHITNQCT